MNLFTYFNTQIRVQYNTTIILLLKHIKKNPMEQSITTTKNINPESANPDANKITQTKQGFIQSPAQNTSHAQLDKFLLILSKTSQERTHKQITFLMEYVTMNKGLNQLSEKVSPKFVRILLMKYAQPICVSAGRTIAKQGDKINYIYVTIYGKVVTDRKIINFSTNDINNQNSNEGGRNSALEKLSIVARNQIKQMNRLKKRKPSRRLSIDCLAEFRDFSNQVTQFNLEQFQQTDIVGIEDRSVGVKYLYNAVVTEGSLLLQISISGFLNALAQCTQQKINIIYEKIHYYPCFNGLERQIIQNFILALSQHKQKRGNYIYKQGQPTKSIYLLSSGQIKLTKQSNLFVQNPNNLYANRLHLMLQNTKQQKTKARYQIKQHQIKKAQASLPYSDLSLMYNFSPKKKVVEISRVHAFCLFGGQEVIQNKNRETNAICNTLDVTYFQIGINKIKEIIGVKNMHGFIKGLKNQAKDKVLHRQSHFANTIHLQNKSNLNYFYFEGQEQKKSHHKIRMLKINNKMQQSDRKTNYKSLDQKTSTVLPHFTAFNFHKITTSPLNLKKAESQQHSQQNPESNRHDQAEQTIQVSHENKQQMKIMNITHTWKLIKKKVDAEVAKSQKLSPQKFVIDVNDPLIDNKYFTNLDKEKRRVERQIRKDRITLGQSRASQLAARRTVNF